MLNKIVLLAVAIQLFTCTPVTTAKSDGFNKNKSRAKLLLQMRSDASNFQFYPAYVGGGQEARKHLLKLDSTAYVLPEPGCTCVPRIKDCDFECCYCELNCPLPKSSTYTGDWLTSLYGNGCKARESDQQNSGVSGRQRRLAAWRNFWTFCDKSEYYMNAQMTSFPFICVHYDNSYTSLHYSMTPTRPNLIRMTNLTPVKYTWPFTQRFYNNCLPTENTGKEGLEKSIDKRYLLLLRVHQLFYLQPPPPKFMNSQKGQLSHDTMCLSQRKNIDEITTFKRKTIHQMRDQQDPLEILDQAIEHLGQRKTNFLANFKVKLKKMSQSCQQYRNDLLKVSKFWLRKFDLFAQGNQTKNINITQLETENLSKSGNRKSEIVTDNFPDKCRSVVAGMEFRVLFSRGDVFKITRQIFTHDVAAKSSPSLFIQIISLSPTKLISGNLSRFWSDFMLYECPEQFCWRDIFDFSYLLADSVVIIIVFLFVVILSALIFTKVGFYSVL